MIEGIIQKVFKHTYETQEELMQELIAEIKKENALKYLESKDGTIYLNLIPPNKLIGDNKE